MSEVIRKSFPKGFGNFPTAEQMLCRQGRRLCPQYSKAERTVLHTAIRRVQDRYWVPLPNTHEQGQNAPFFARKDAD